MRRISIVAAFALAVLALAGQFVAPRIAAKQVEKRLTKGGGSAHAEVHALPWPRLLFTEGDSIKVRANGIQLPIATPGKPVLKELDGFNTVDIEVTDSSTGPMRITRLSLKKKTGPYQIEVQGSVSPSDVAAFVTGFALPFGTTPVPVDVAATIRSEGGVPHAVVADGTVAGLPAGPIVEVLAQALAGRF
jgi:hypothetical protein